MDVADPAENVRAMQFEDSFRINVGHWLALLLLVVVGCVQGPLPGPKLETELIPPFSESGELVHADRWWTSFDIPQLDFQIHIALNHNYSLASALQRVRAARAIARREASDFWPDIDGVLDIGSTFGPGEDRTSYIWGFDSAYQVDLWGEIESRVDAQRFRAQATCFDYHAIALTLSADIARIWFSLMEAHAQLELLDQQIQTNRTGLEVQESRFGLGLIRSADVLRQRQLLESTFEQKAVAQAQVEILEHQLAVLMGQIPQTADYDTGSQLPELPPLPSTGLPSELLCRRPDVRRDFTALQAADRDLAAAISSLYPRLNLSGSLLNIAENPGDLFRDWFISIGGQLIAPLFDGGQRRAEVDRTSAVKCQLFNEYAQTVLVALQEVEDALVQEKYQIERIEHLEEQVELAGQSSEQLREQYLIGDAEYLDVLSAITAQQRLQRQLLSAQLELILIRISLYLALAGDFDPDANPLEYWQDLAQDEPLDRQLTQENQDNLDSIIKEVNPPETNRHE